MVAVRLMAYHYSCLLQSHRVGWLLIAGLHVDSDLPLPHLVRPPIFLQHPKGSMWPSWCKEPCVLQTAQHHKSFNGFDSYSTSTVAAVLSHDIIWCPCTFLAFRSPCCFIFVSSSLLMLEYRDRHSSWGQLSFRNFCNYVILGHADATVARLWPSLAARKETVMTNARESRRR